MSDPALVFEQVTRTYGRTLALDRCDLAVQPGTVTGIVGRNGAGKTTALRLAMGILWPDSGRIRVLGLDPVKQGVAVRTRVSLLSEESALYPWMTVAEIVRFAGALHPRWDADLAESFRKRLDLDPKAKIKTLSRGTKAKVALVLAAAARPEILLLDDPTAGLDPLVRREVLEGILETVPGEGGAVLYASHMIGDLERLADRIVWLDRGRIRLDGAVDDLKERIRRVIAVFPGDAPREIPIPGLLDLSIDGRVATLVAEAANGDLEAALRAQGATSVEIDALSLEDILVACLKEARGREPDRV